MKKRRLFTLAMLGAAVMFTTACSDDEEDEPIGPTLTMEETGTATTGGAITITEGDGLDFTWDTRKGETNLNTFNLVITGVFSTSEELTTTGGEVLPYDNSGSDKQTYVDGISIPNAGVTLGTTKYTFTSTDGIGKSKSVSFTVTVEEESAATNPLDDVESFTWQRVGGDPGTGLSQFGLQWTSNSTTSAIVKIDGSGTSMVMLNAADWTGITTKEALALAIGNGTTFEQYEGVSVEQDDTEVNDVLGVNYNGINYMLRINSSTVELITGGGADVTIFGSYKK